MNQLMSRPSSLQEWQWCYFEQVSSGRRESTFKHNDGDPNFEETEFGCGFHIENVTRSDQGISSGLFFGSGGIFNSFIYYHVNG